MTAGLVAALAPAAHAVTNVAAAGNVLTVTAAPGFANTINVTQPGLITIEDFGDMVIPGAGCNVVNANTVECVPAGITTINVTLDDGNDLLNYNPAGAGGLLDAGTGNDTIQLGAGAGSSSLVGGSGNDTLAGGMINDMLDGGLGSDSLNGGGGTDVADYRARVNQVIADLDGVADDGTAGEMDNVQPDVETRLGGGGSDVLTGNNSVNTLTGGNGNDTLNGLGGGDTLTGGDGNDTLNGGFGNDTLEGGNGADTAATGAIPDGADQFNGGRGIDTVSYQPRATAVNVTLNGIANDGAAGELDNALANVENAQGGAVADTLVGNASANVLTGWAGNDTLQTIDGLMGNDTANGSAGTDTCFTDAGDIVISCP